MWGGGGTEYMRLTSTGLGIKTTNPQYPLDVSGTIRATGDVIAYSDRRLKKHIRPIENAIERVLGLSGYTFTRKDTGERMAGVIAQEVEKVLPEAIRTDSQGMMSVSPPQMIGLLVQAVNELTQEVNELKEKLK